MEGNNVSADHVIAELINMGFEFDKAVEAVEAVGPCLEDTVEFILNGSCNGNSVKNEQVSSLSSPSTCSTSQTHPLGRRVSSRLPTHRMKQSSITDHISSSGKTKRSNRVSPSDASVSGTQRCTSRNQDEEKVSSAYVNVKLEPISESSQQDSHAHVNCVKLEMPTQEIGTYQSPEISRYCSLPGQEIGLEDWEQKVRGILKKHFGFSSLKSFQKEAMEAWLAHRDCLVLAATGSGKSLCFQIPALLSGKIVVVISPLISLMHDQCLKLAKHRISACFLGSGQPDRTVECKAMSGMYKIIYVCPETVLRLIEPLKRLAETPGIALFAIDEVHCVSKWGHDFRPDYRRLSVLRENFRSCNLKSLKFDIPLMALTATATVPVREDIVKSLHMSKETKIVLTSFFRPNLRFSVKHSRTTSPSSYDKDFCELIETYAVSRGKKRKGPTKILNYVEDNSRSSCKATDCSSSDADEALVSDSSDSEDECSDDDIGASMANMNSALPSDEYQLTSEYLEDEVDVHLSVDDLDVSCGEFPGNPPLESSEFHGASDMSDTQESLQQGPTIIYVPTRKETTKIAQYLSKFGVKAEAYHAKVVVATIAFGMGIDKSNVRRIIHYGWPQCLEAYYQEAGRAGRDGKLSDCTLYANLSRIPTLLPNQRSEEQTKQAYKMLSDCFRYGMCTATCRAKALVKYFGEEFSYDKCQLCDVCVNGPPEMQNLMEEAAIFMRVIKAQCGTTSFGHVSHNGAIYSESSTRMFLERPNFKLVVSKIREQFQKFSASDMLWWRGLARILEDKGFIREGNELARVSINRPELTELGLRFLCSESEQTLHAYPEADMLFSTEQSKPLSSFAEWGRGWADPEIRRQRLQGRKGRSRKRKRKFRKPRQDMMSTVRGRLSAKLSKQKR